MEKGARNSIWKRLRPPASAMWNFGPFSISANELFRAAVLPKVSGGGYCPPTPQSPPPGGGGCESPSGEDDQEIVRHCCKL
eukprot:14242424-Alexandrium_andersonii.AAC.1